MKSTPVFWRALPIVLGLLGASLAWAQSEPYPNKPVRFVTTPSGSGSDVIARILRQALEKNLGQPIVVDNRGNIAAEIVAHSKPDGYTLLCYGPTAWISPLINTKVNYDAERDFVPITMVGFSPNVVVVHPSLPVKSVKDLVALAKAHPGKLNYSSGSVGSGSHLTAELFKSLAGVNIVGVAYRGSVPGLVALVSGEVEMAFPNAGVVAPFTKSGKLRALAVTTLRRSALTPGLPTVAESGVPGFESTTPFGYFAPAGTPPEIIDKLHEGVLRALAAPGVKERLFRIGIEAVGDTPQEFAAMIKADIAKWRKLIKEAGIAVN